MTSGKISIAERSRMSGQSLVNYLSDYLTDIVVPTRADVGAEKNYRKAPWKGKGSGVWQAEVDGGCQGDG